MVSHSQESLKLKCLLQILHLQIFIESSRPLTIGLFDVPWFLFVSMLLIVTVNKYGHIGMVTSNFVGLLPDIEMSDIPSTAKSSIPVKLLSLYAGKVLHATSFRQSKAF